MSQAEFIESGFRFSFSNEWNVLAFDKTAYYRAISGLGVKGVDFLGIYKEQLYFVEIKNFNQHRKIEAADFDFINFSSKIITKFEDSQRAIRIINTYYKRKRFLRFIAKFGFMKEFTFWEACFNIVADHPGNVHRILCMSHTFDEEIVKEKIISPIEGYLETVGFGFSFFDLNDGEEFQELGINLKKI